MKISRISLLVILGVALTCGVASAQITISKYMDFDQDGVLPSADSDVAFRNMYASGLEAGIFTVTGGSLIGNSMPSANNYVGYAWPNGTLTGGGLSNTDDWMIECRVRVLDMNQLNVNSRVASMNIWTGNQRWMMYHVNGAIRWDLGGSTYTEIPYDISQWHVMRFQKSGNHVAAIIDGVEYASNVFGTNDAKNGFEIQLTSSNSGAIAEWDYVHLESGPDAVAVEGAAWGQVKSLYR